MIVPFVILNSGQRIAVLTFREVESGVELLEEVFASEVEEALPIITSFASLDNNRAELIIWSVEVPINGK